MTGAGTGASGQVDDPYGTTTTTEVEPTTTTTALDCETTIELSTQTGASGATVTATAECFPAGAVVTFTFDGQPVGTATSTPRGGGTAQGSASALAAVSPARLLNGIFGSAQTSNTPTVAQARFRVPAKAPGTYPVCATAEGAVPACTTFRVVGQVGESGRDLARTGAIIAPFVALGVGLVFLGRYLRAGSGRPSARS